MQRYDGDKIINEVLDRLVPPPEPFMTMKFYDSVPKRKGNIVEIGPAYTLEWERFRIQNTSDKSLWLEVSK